MQLSEDFSKPGPSESFFKPVFAEADQMVRLTAGRTLSPKSTSSDLVDRHLPEDAAKPSSLYARYRLKAALRG